MRDTFYGIICLTRANLDSPWVLFEAGALSKLDASHISTFLLGLKPSDIKSPLADFQATLYNEADVKKLIKSINNSLEHPRAETNLEGTWRLWWPEFKSKIDPLELRSKEETSESEQEATVANPGALEEILTLVREQQRLLSAPEMVLPPDYLRTIVRQVRMFDDVAQARRKAVASNDLDTDLAGAHLFGATLDGTRLVEATLKMDPTPVVDRAAAVTKRIGDKIVGNKKTRVFYLATAADLPGESNRVYFESVEEATGAGFTPTSDVDFRDL